VNAGPHGPPHSSVIPRQRSRETARVDARPCAATGCPAPFSDRPVVPPSWFHGRIVPRGPPNTPRPASRRRRVKSPMDRALTSARAEARRPAPSRSATRPKPRRTVRDAHRPAEPAGRPEGPRATSEPRAITRTAWGLWAALPHPKGRRASPQQDATTSSTSSATTRPPDQERPKPPTGSTRRSRAPTEAGAPSGRTHPEKVTPAP